MKTTNATTLLKTLRECKTFHEAIELLDSNDSVVRNGLALEYYFEGAIIRIGLNYDIERTIKNLRFALENGISSAPVIVEFGSLDSRASYLVTNWKGFEGHNPESVPPKLELVSLDSRKALFDDSSLLVEKGFFNESCLRWKRGAIKIFTKNKERLVISDWHSLTVLSEFDGAKFLYSLRHLLKLPEVGTNGYENKDISELSIS